MAAPSTYRLHLRLTGPVSEPSFLVSAIAAAYPGAEVVAVTLTGPDTAVALVRFRKGVPALVPGDTMAPITQGLELLGQGPPLAILEKAEPVADPPIPMTSRSLIGALREVELADVGRLALAIAMVGTTAWLIHRIPVPKHKGGAHADARAT